MLPDTPIEIVLFILVYTLAFFTSIRVIMDTRNAAKALGYLLLVITIPVIGSFLYFSLGVNYRKKRIYSKKLIANDWLWQKIKQRIISSTNQILEQKKNLIGGQEDLIKLLLNDSLEPLSQNRVTLLINGERKFPEVISALENAKHFIHLEYYIYEDNAIGYQIRDILIRKARAGVIVRFIYDDFGSKDLKNKFLNPMVEAGVEVYPFFKVYFALLASRINYRNHRKIIVTDCQVGFVGGINVSDRYINNGDPTKLFWRDTHVKIEGPAVLSLQYHFLADWNFCSGQQVAPDETMFLPYQQLSKGDSLVQVVASGPDYPRQSIMLCYFTAIINAKEKVYITSPYFIPNNSINDAIRKAALSGKDVRLLVPGISDSTVVNAASQSYFDELLECGVKIYLYKKGFVHAKTIIVDDALAIVGTANMDFRSFELNFEISAVIYGQEPCGELTRVFLDDLEHSDLISFEAWRHRSKPRQWLEKAARLLSPIL
ncbi:MAG: cardiolipin synthase [Cyclobacteriaceae bacterium]|nr:cardiolipin synthase [Cyclobacteriaceae bacterium]